jgi:hypothetical protein
MDLWKQVCENGRWAEVVRRRVQSSVISSVPPYLIANLSKRGEVDLPNDSKVGIPNIIKKR